MRDLVFTAMFMGMALLALRSAHLGMMLWVWSALFPPNEFLFGFAQNISFNKISVACTILALLYDKRKSFTIDSTLVCLLLFFSEVSVSYALSTTPADWGSELYERLAKVVIAALCIRFIATDRLRLHSILLAICLAIGSGAVDEGLKFVISAGGHHAKGPSSWGDENITATIILMAMPLILYIHRYSQKQILRQACLCGMAACVVAVIGSYSRGGFIGLIIFGTTFLVATKHRAVAIVLIVIVIAVGVNFVPDSWVERIHSTGNVDQDASFMGRIIQWKILTLMALDHPFFGEGILANMLPEIWSSYAVRLGSELMFVSTPVPTIPYASHSIFFQVLGENGFTGLFLFLLLYWVAFAAVSDIRRRARRAPGVTWTLDLARAIRMSLLLYLVTGAALPIPYLELPYLLLGCLSALRHIQRREIARLSQEERSGDGVEAISAPAPRLASGRRGATAAGGMPMRGEGLPPQRERLISVNLRSW